MKVAYDVLPHTVSLAAARKEGSTLVFQNAVKETRTEGDEPEEGAPAATLPLKGNVRGPKTSGKGETGDVEKAFAEAEGTLEVVTTTSVQHHVCMETHSLYAEWVGDTLEVQASTQGTFSVRDELAEVFKLSKDKVVVRAEFTGGGFGSKFGAGDYGVFAAKLAKKAGKPVLDGPRPQGREPLGRQPARLVEPRQARVPEGRHRHRRRLRVVRHGRRRDRHRHRRVREGRLRLPRREGRRIRRLHAPRPRLRDARPGPPAGMLRRRDGARGAREPPRNGPARAPAEERPLGGPACGVGDRREGVRLVAPRGDHEGERGRRSLRQPAPAGPRLRRVPLVHVRRARLAGPRAHPPRRDRRGRERRAGHRRRSPDADRDGRGGGDGSSGRVPPRENRRLALPVRPRVGRLRDDRLPDPGRARRRRPRPREARGRRREGPRRARNPTSGSPAGSSPRRDRRSTSRRSARAFPATRSSRPATARRITTAPTRGSSACSSPRSSWTSRPASWP